MLVMVSATSVINVFAQINSIPMLNEMNFKVWKEVVEIVLGCMDLDLTLWVEEPIPTLDNLQEGCLWSQLPSDDEIFIFVGDGNKVAVEKINIIKSDRGGEYYGRYDGLGEQRPRCFALFLKEYEIVSQYTIVIRGLNSRGLVIGDRILDQFVQKCCYYILGQNNKSPLVNIFCNP
ncbi:hypothetical protein CR513_20955, partial [Mucuna pruriens]